MIKDPKTGKDVTNPAKIKQVSLEYCVELLTNRAPKDEFKEEVEMKKLVHKVRMTELLTNIEPKEEFKEEVEMKKLVHKVRMTEEIDHDIDELTIEHFNKAI